MSIPACDIIIAYHSATLRWVSTSIDSALNQQNVRCIVHVVADEVDEADDQRIRNMFSGSANIRFYRNAKSIGPYQSVHRVFDCLETPHIAIQDSDDLSLPHRIRFSLDALERHRCDVFGGAMENFVDWQWKSHPTIRAKLAREGRIMHSGVSWSDCPSGWIANPTMVVKKSAFQALNGFAPLYTCADLEFSERVHRYGVPVHYSKAIVVLRRLHGQSLSSNDDTGHSSRYMKNLTDRLIRSYVKYRSDVDPRQFGCLDDPAAWISVREEGKTPL